MRPPPAQRVERRRLLPWLLATGVFGLVAKRYYRNFIHASGVNDLGLSGVLPSYAWAAFLSFVFALWWSPRVACLTALGSSVLYELEQMRHDGLLDAVLSTGDRTFDVWDIVAALAGSATAYLVLRRMVPVAGQEGPGQDGRP